MFKMANKFNGSFNTKCQEKYVPVSLLALVAMVLNGPHIKAQSSSSSVPQTALTISQQQLLMYNSVLRQHRPQGNPTTRSYRHNRDRETPLAVYLGVMIHTKTHKRDLVNTLFDLHSL